MQKVSRTDFPHSSFFISCFPGFPSSRQSVRSTVYRSRRLSYRLFVFRKRINAAYLSSIVSAFSVNSRLSDAAVRNLASISDRCF